ncbi:putative macrophage erythroblast attacher isoform 1 [Lyophyllum shimeji]|uniref:Macrophage erythroblast attacher isoform 1 n=1 Tax=Lyophyllum shimeji TaxID=47721 RepID=A0A9P3PFE4_LYOSH|nr:putative macrophage erythroblast attacher isoform 1 [Lyophyllum shimeji]
MAIMTLPIALPSTPSSANSPSSDNDSANSASKPAPSSPGTNNTTTSNNPPRTPVSPVMPGQTQPSPPATQQQPQASPQTQVKRKPSRRANTAERRATHNAVERQRRETLNGRFLDLAALLPNLSQIRRPSKSSIVNSSIAHIHASRRHRMLASRELRLLKLEADALRRELNEWRERAGIPRIEEPVRGEGFSMVIGGELEVIVGVPGAEEADDDEDMDGPGTGGGNPAYGGYVGGDGVLHEDEFRMDALDASGVSGSPAAPGGGLDDPRMLAMLKNHQNPFAHDMPPPTPGGAPGLPHILPRPGSMGNGPTNVPAFDALYDHYPPQGVPHHGAHHPHAAVHPHHPPQHSQQHLLQQQHAYIQQQHAHVLREREREREIRERERDREIQIRERERAIIQQQQQQHHHHQQQEQEKMWGMYPPSRGYPGAQQGPYYPSQGQNGPANGNANSNGNGNGQSQQMMMMQAQRSLFTPPATSHGLPTPSPTGTHASNGTGPGGVQAAGSPASSSASGEEMPPHQPQQRERSGSVHSRSSRGSHSPSYELGVGMGPVGDYMSVGAGMPEYVNGAVGIPRMGGGMMGMDMLGVGVEMN